MWKELSRFESTDWDTKQRKHTFTAFWANVFQMFTRFEHFAMLEYTYSNDDDGGIADYHHETTDLSNIIRAKYL